jgi:hypothetical protein
MLLRVGLWWSRWVRQLGAGWEWLLRPKGDSPVRVGSASPCGEGPAACGEARRGCASALGPTPCSRWRCASLRWRVVQGAWTRRLRGWFGGSSS